MAFQFFINERNISKRGKKDVKIVIFFLWLHFLIFILGTFFVSGDLAYYFRQASSIFNGKIPYKDFSSVYPPFSLMLFILPRIFTSNFFYYVFFFALEIFFINLFGVFLMIQVARWLNFKTTSVLGIYTLFLFLLIPVISTRYDLFPAVLTFLSFFSFFLNKAEIVWGSLFLGTLAKIYPIFLAPLFGLFYFQKKDYKNLLKGVFIFLFLFFFLIFGLIFAYDGTIAFLKSNLTRPLHIESLAGSIFLLANCLGLHSLKREIGGSWSLRSSKADFIANLSPLFLFFGLFLIYWLYFQSLKKELNFCKDQNFFLNFPFANYFLVVLLGVILLNKVFSPQYFLWLCPFIPFIKGRGRKISLFILIFTAGLTTFIYPINYLALWEGKFLPTFVLFLRNFLLIIAIYFLLQWKASSWNLDKTTI